MGLREEIQKKGLPSEPFEMEGIEAKVAVRALSPAQMLKLGAMAESDDEALMGKVAAWVLINPETGERHFSDDDADFLMDHLSLADLKRIGDASKRLSGVLVEEGKDG